MNKKYLDIKKPKIIKLQTHNQIKKKKKKNHINKIVFIILMKTI